MTEGIERSKELTLKLLARLLPATDVKYAVIGGLAVQVYLPEPRTTLDIDLAVQSITDDLVQSLTEAGFKHTGRHQHSDNWIGPDGTPLQITDDRS